ncbi:MAG: protein kinase family protein [Candidatus Margulisbacteria bacterium]|nr:protein kinase family protein [Candidatus Margulisiibacteriota bacterium]
MPLGIHGNHHIPDSKNQPKVSNVPDGFKPASSKEAAQAAGDLKDIDKVKMIDNWDNNQSHGGSFRGMFHYRSTLLKAIDKTIKAYSIDKSPDKLQAISKAISEVEERDSHLGFFRKHIFKKERPEAIDELKKEVSKLLQNKAPNSNPIDNHEKTRFQKCEQAKLPPRYKKGETLRIGNTRYTFQDPIGNGNNAKVWSVRSDGKMFALKIVSGKKGEDTQTSILKEANISHEPINALFNPTGMIHRVAKDQSKYLILMDQVPGYNLEEYLETPDLSTHQRRKIFYDVMLSGLRDLEKFHSVGVVHADVKPANFIYDIESGDPSIIDFGSAQNVDEPFSCLRTLGYFNPQMILDSSKNDPELLKSQDIYALIVTGIRILLCTHNHYSKLYSREDGFNHGEVDRIHRENLALMKKEFPEEAALLLPLFKEVSRIDKFDQTSFENQKKCFEAGAHYNKNRVEEAINSE